MAISGEDSCGQSASKEHIDLRRSVVEAQKKFGLTQTRTADLSGISVRTLVKFCRHGRLPKHARCLDGLRAFARRAAVAKSRADLGGF